MVEEVKDSMAGIPDELKVLNPEWQKKHIMVGSKVMELYPLTEGQAEKLSATIAEIVEEIYTTDMACPECKDIVIEGALDQEEKLRICPKCGKELISLQKSPTEVLLKGGRITNLLHIILGVLEVDAKRATIPQLKYIAGILFTQNFDDEATLPVGADGNFRKLLSWMGLTGELKADPPPQVESQLEKSTKPLQVVTDSPANTSKGNGETED